MTSIVFRAGRPEDFDFCARLYFAAFEETIRVQRLYRRLGFFVIRDDPDNYFMRRDPLP
jgi:hypothetical protein